MKKQLFFSYLMAGFALSTATGVFAADDDDVAAAAPEHTASAPAAQTKTQRENQRKMLRAELNIAAKSWQRFSGPNDEDDEVARQVADFCRSLASIKLPAGREALLQRLERMEKSCAQEQMAYEQGHKEAIARLEQEEESLKVQRAKARAGERTGSSVEDIDAALKANLEQISTHVIGHLRGAALLYCNGLLTVVDEIGDSLGRLHMLLGGSAAGGDEDDDDEEIAWDNDEWAEDEDAWQSAPEVGETEKRAAIANMVARQRHQWQTAAGELATVMQSGRARAEHQLIGAVIKKLPALYAIAKADAQRWQDYFNLFADDEEGPDRVSAKTAAEAGWHTARGRAAHIYLQQQRLEGIGTSLKELHGKTDDGHVYERLMNERGKIQAGDMTAGTMQQVLSRMEAVQRFTSTGPLRGAREDMHYRLNACQNLTPYLRVMHASVAALVSRFAPGVFTAGKVEGKAAQKRSRDRHEAAAKEAAKKPAPAAADDETASATSSTDADSSNDGGSPRAASPTEE